MILELPKISKDKYEERKKEFYTKPNIPEIEKELEEFQKELLLESNFSILPKFRDLISTYSKSLLLKELKGSTDFIDLGKVEALADQAADNFIKRYFRAEDPIVGASFAGILQYKVREVLAYYFRGEGLETNVSIDTEIGSDSNNMLTVEQILAFKSYVDNENFEESQDIEVSLNLLEGKINRELELLKKIKREKNLDLLFLQYLLLICILQKYRLDKKLSTVSAQALKLVSDNSTQLNRLTPIFESALLDIIGTAD